MRAVKNEKRLIMMPTQKKIMEQVGAQIRLARKRRKLSTEVIAARANISRSTLWHIEQGSPSVCIGMYLKVLHALGMAEDMLCLAKDDQLGRLLQDIETEKRNGKSN